MAETAETVGVYTSKVRKGSIRSVSFDTIDCTGPRMVSPVWAGIEEVSLLKTSMLRSL